MNTIYGAAEKLVKPALSLKLQDQ